MTGPESDRPAPVDVEARGTELFETAEQLLGHRLAEGRRDPDGRLRITVVDPTDADRSALLDAAQQLGVADRLRLERADPRDLELWEQLRHELVALRAATPGVLGMSPSPHPGYERPPVRITLDATAEAVAADLYERYGDFLHLSVGALRYPLSANPPRTAEVDRDARPLPDPGELTVAPASPFTVRSGATATLTVLLHNHGTHPVSVNTTGSLHADVLDPATGHRVGGLSGFFVQPLICFRAAAGDTVEIPLLIGTDSVVAALGFLVPPGQWQVTAPLDLGDGRQLRIPPLPLKVTA